MLNVSTFKKIFPYEFVENYKPHYGTRLNFALLSSYSVYCIVGY